MAKKKTKKEPPELKVVFDTNALYTKVASDLFKHEVGELIKKNSNHPDLKITWCLPDVVMHERQYQMRNKGKELLPSIEKLERLLGYSIGINEAIIEKKVGDAIQKHIKYYSIKLVNLNTDNVNLHRMMIDAAYRHPPFEAGEKEKGFRDALIVETFMQIVANSPSNPKICRVALVSDDGLLRDAVKNLTYDLSNVRLLSSLGELEGLISTLISEFTEEFVQRIQEEAEKYFFIPDDSSTLFYKKDIAGEIVRRFRAALDAIPKGADFRRNGTWHKETPRFVEKKDRRVFWASRIIVEAESYKDLRPKSTWETSTIFRLRGSETPASVSKWRLPGGSAAEPSVHECFPLRYVEERLVAAGESVFEVIWSVLVDVRRKIFSSPNIESIEFIETSWYDAP
jgi:hypothetical protein